MKISTLLLWVLRLVAAGILLQTLFFKFTAAPESVYIFSTLGVEPWGRILSGVIELVAAVLILIPATTAVGAVIGAGTMAGAIMSHLTVLGISVKDDHGQLFAYACIVLISCLVLAYRFRKQLPFFKQN